MNKNTNEAAHPDFSALNQSVFVSNKLLIKQLQIETESQDYGALHFNILGKSIQFRVGKSTPKKVGYFVTVWKRLQGITVPYNSTDHVDFFIITVRDNKNFGFFMLPKKMLIKHKILSHIGKGGKLGFRIYPPWAATTNQQAKKTQAWQVQCFYDLSEKSIDHQSFLDMLLTETE